MLRLTLYYSMFSLFLFIFLRISSSVLNVVQLINYIELKIIFNNGIIHIWCYTNSIFSRTCKCTPVNLPLNPEQICYKLIFGYVVHNGRYKYFLEVPQPSVGGGAKMAPEVCLSKTRIVWSLKPS